MAILFGLLNRLRGGNANSGVPAWMRLLASIIVYVVYIMIGAAIIQAIEEDEEFDATNANAKWNFGSSCYFMVVTTTTIGYGDIAPITSGGRAFTAVYGLIGLGLVGYVISMAGGAVMDIMSWQRKMFVKYVLRQKGTKSAGDVNVPFYVAHSALITACVTWLLFLFIGAAIFQETEKLDDAEKLAAGTTTATEWSYRNALWFCWVTLTTIGYGDFFPTTNAGKVLLPLYAVLSLGVVGIVIGEVGEAVARSAEKALVGSGGDDSPVDAKIASESIKGTTALAKSLSGGRRFDSREVRRDTVAALRSALAAAENARVGDSPASSSSSSDASSSSSYASNSSSYASRSIGGVEDGSYSDYSYSEEDYSY